MQNKVKVLITVPDLTRPGGVAALYNISRIDKVEHVQYFSLHSAQKAGKITRLLELVFIYIRFAIKALSVKVVHVNPSMMSKSYQRDGVFVFIARMLGKKVLVYWHGWDSGYAASIPQRKLPAMLFSKAYSKAGMHVVLGHCFAQELMEMGITPDRIKIESNAASDEYQKGADPVKSIAKPPVNFLFIARLETVKGIYTAIDIIKKLKEEGYDVHFDIAGGGAELDNVKELVAKSGLDNIITVHGNVAGMQKHALFSKGHILLFPTMHKEGMPITILEAMLYGLPVMSTRTGGIPDWVEHGVNGYLLPADDVAAYTDCIRRLISNPAQYETMARVNYQKAQAQFLPDTFNERLLNYYQTLSPA